jgi:hypothetical protein
MKTSEFKLPLEASREVAMAIIDQLPREEFTSLPKYRVCGEIIIRVDSSF